MGGVLLVATCWWPSSAHLAHVLVRAGCRVSVLCPAGHPARAVPGVTIRRHRGLMPLRALARAVAACRPDVVVPTDDRAAQHLHRLHRTGTAAQRALVERSIGRAEGFEATISRARLLDVARSLGIAVPDGMAISDTNDLETWLGRVPAPWVLKVDGAWGGDGVRICATRAEARAAFAALSRWRSVGRVLRRVVIDGDAFWVSDRLRRRAPEVTAQAHVAGRSGNLAMLCRDGEVLAASVAETVRSTYPTGPAAVVEAVDRPELVAAARLIARELRLSGFHGLDFMVEEGTGRALPIELNPRPTPLCAVRFGPGADLVGAFVTQLCGRPCRAPATPPAAPQPRELVAFFPAARRSGCDEAYLASCFHDVPVEEPALVAEMLRRSWPERRFLARVAWRLRSLRRRGERV